jgi:hypothetical protein
VVDTASLLTGDQLARILESLGIRFLMGRKARPEVTPTGPPARQLAALAQCPEARLRMARLPFFMQRRGFAAHALDAASGLPASARLTLQCCYGRMKVSAKSVRGYKTASGRLNGLLISRSTLT